MSTNALHVFRETNGGDFYAAASLESAIAIWVKDTGMEVEEGDWESLQDEHPLTLHVDDGSPVTKTCGEWVAECVGPGAFAGEDY